MSIVVNGRPKAGPSLLGKSILVQDRGQDHNQVLVHSQDRIRDPGRNRVRSRGPNHNLVQSEGRFWDKVLDVRRIASF